MTKKQDKSSSQPALKNILNKWIITGSTAVARQSHTATLLEDGKVLIAGGADEHNVLASAELYNPATGLWAPTGSLGVARIGHTATLLASGKVLVAGGLSTDLTELKATHTAELYDPATGQWSRTGELKNARSSHTATRLRSELVLASGGTGDQDFPDRIDSAELYDPAIGEWLSTGSLTLDRGRTSHTATLLDNGMVLAVGGITFGAILSSGAELYDPGPFTFSGTWTPTGNPSALRFDHTAGLLRNGKVLVVGGVKSLGPTDELDSAELYDRASGKWAATGSLSTARHQHTATLLRNGQVLVAGGFKGSTLGSSESYDPALGKWSTTAALNTARGEHSATLLQDGRVLVVGGLQLDPPGPVTLDSAELYSLA